MNLMLVFRHLLVITFIAFCNAKKYDPNWESLDSRPLPSWFDEAKIGIFLHWGVFSVPSFQSEWFWVDWKSNESSVVDYMNKNYAKTFIYPDFAKDFTAEFFNATEWAEIFAGSGAKYIVLTSKHHEGYTMWPSKYSFNWNAKDVGPGRDLLGELAGAVRAKNLTFGVYHSLFEWYNRLYNNDKQHLFLTNDFVVNKMIPEMIELIETYKPAVLWSDGDWEAPDVYWKSTNFLAWLYNESPVKDVIVTNDRWGIGTPCHHGGFYSCNDRYNPGVLQKHKWENAMTIDKRSWGFRRNARLEDYFTNLELLTEVASTVSCGGNILMNIGPTKDGIIAPIFQDRLKGLGEWLKINGEAIYGSKPWSAQNDTLTSGVWYTSKDKAVYAIVLFWPEGNTLEIASALPLLKKNKAMVSMLGSKGTLKWEANTAKVQIDFPDKATVKSKDAYVLKFERSPSVSLLKKN